MQQRNLLVKINDVLMESVNFVILGDQSIATEFGKKGTSTDLTLFDRKESEKIYEDVRTNMLQSGDEILIKAVKDWPPATFSRFKKYLTNN